MATYSVPPDFSEKEKIVGGILTAAQLICILIGIGCAAVSSFILYKILGLGGAGIIISVVIFIPVGGVFALLKIKGLPLYEYLRLKKKHKQIVKKLPNYRAEADEFELSYLEKNK